MMPARRRVRYIALLLVLALTALVYSRRARLEEYGSTVAEKVVGGGAVLRTPEGQQGHSVAIAPTTAAPLAATSVASHQAVLQPTRPPTSVAPELQPEVESPSTSSTAAGAAIVPSTTAPPASPLWRDREDEGEGAVEVADRPRVDATPSATHSTTHWTQPPERFPISLTIALPTGSPRPIPKIQYQGDDAGKVDSERRAIIKAATSHAWQGYKEAGFGADEIKPISGNNPKFGGGRSRFNGWGATLVDSLDTLWIMGMEDEFNEAVEAVRKIDFTTSSRPDIPLFETVIRYLGGLVAAYDISGRQRKYTILLDRAVQLAEILYGAFDTPNRMPETYYPWMPPDASKPHLAGNKVVLAELGSLSLEFTRLAQLTGEPKYYDAIARITDALDEWQSSTRIAGMWPMAVNASGCEKPAEEASSELAGAAPETKNAAEAAEEEALGPADTLPLWTKPRKAQAASGTLKGNKRPGGGKNIEHDESSSIGSPGNKSSDKLGSEGLGSANAKTKRQLDLLSSNEQPFFPPETETSERTSELRGDTSAGAGVCIPRGLAASSRAFSEVYTLGAQSDSTYEYLPKQYLLLGGRVEQYRKMYEYSADTAIKHLMVRPMTPENLDLLISGKIEFRKNLTTGEYDQKFTAESEHLTCFAGGMFAMAGKIFDRPDDVEIGRKLTEGCVWGYNSTRTGIMPEVFTAMTCQDHTDKECPWDEKAYWTALDPHADARTMQPLLADSAPTATAMASPVATAAATTTTEAIDRAHEKRDAAPQDPDRDEAKSLQEGDVKKKDAYVASDSRERAQPNPSTTTQQAYAPAPSRTASPAGSGYHDQAYSSLTPPTHEEFVKHKIADDRLPPGFVKINDPVYLLRPEAIESVFYLYRITGEEYWREAGWQMFLAIDRYTRTLYGNSAIDDVTKGAPEMKDTMESFWLAETLKYFYLLFDDKDTWSLDDWVLNTEAHFFRRPT